MNKRENLLCALRREAHEYTPFHLRLCASQIEELYKKTGTRDYEEYFDLCARFIRLAPTQHCNDYSQYSIKYPANATVNEWGVGQEPGSVAHFVKMHHPMQNFSKPEEVEAYPYPDVLAEYRWQPVHETVKTVHEAGQAAVYYAIQVFEPAWYLRGMEEMLMDMVCEPEMAAACLNKMVEFQRQHTIKAAQSGVDIIIFGDDVGTQKSMMMSVELWRKWLKPGLASLIQAAKAVNPDILAFYHSDGVIDDIIGDLIEIGVDILNPVQPECMDPEKIKKQYGNSLSFWGTVGTQTTMPFGSTGEVEQVVKARIEAVGKNGGLCLAPTHVIEPEVPFENICAFVDAAKKYGRIGL